MIVKESVRNMTLGEKIRKYRLLKGWTQKELGLAVGFSAATADSRIRKYERDIMAPKESMREKLAQALDVDLSALSDIDVRTYEDVMQVLFLFEDEYEMDIEKREGSTALIFDDSNSRIRTLITYMNIWRNQKKALLPNPESAAPDQLEAYEKWKARFGQNINEYFDEKKAEIQEYYRLGILKAAQNHAHARTTAQITQLLRQAVESGLSVSTAFSKLPKTAAGPGFTFLVSELLSPPSTESARLFSQFLYELDHFKDLGAAIQTEMQMTSRSLTITYYIGVSSFSIIKSQIDILLEYLGNQKDENDFLKDTFETMFADSLKRDSLSIEEEIRLYAK